MPISHISSIAFASRRSLGAQCRQHNPGLRILDDLRVPPNNRLEALSKDRPGQHSIRINDQWRVCFVWRDGSAERVEICDYH